MASRRHPLATTLAVIAALAVPVAASAASSPTVTFMRVHKPTGKPGTLVAVARVSARGWLTREQQHTADGRPRRIAATLRLTRNGVTATATDTVRLKGEAHRGATALLHFRFPSAQARRIGTGPMTSRLRVGLEGMPQVPVLAPRGARQTQINIPGLCIPPPLGTCHPTPAPAPHAPLALDGAVGNSIGGACVAFDGPNANGPHVEHVVIMPYGGFTSGWTIESSHGAHFPVGTDGAFSGEGLATSPPGMAGMIGMHNVTISGTLSPEVMSGRAGTALVRQSDGQLGVIPAEMPMTTRLEERANC